MAVVVTVGGRSNKDTSVVPITSNMYMHIDRLYVRFDSSSKRYYSIPQGQEGGRQISSLSFGFIT